MQDIFDEEEQQWEEEWNVVLSTKAEYTLSKLQAMILRQAMANKERQVMFETFMIPCNFVVEFYRVNRFKKGLARLVATTEEEEYQPIPPEKWKKIKQEIYSKIGKPMKAEDSFKKKTDKQEDERRELLRKQAESLKEDE